ncbi:MAG: mechanosensitive ion channel domain-containing protein [Bacteroidota bacterium]|nr:mechanosensitive ion channel domain-containing protein [Bacteroidota bacterium]
MNVDTILNLTFLDNSFYNYAWFIGFILFGLLFKRIISKYFSHLLYRLVNRDKTIDISTFNKLLIRPISFSLFLMFIYLGSLNILFPDSLNFGNEAFNFKLLVNKGFSIVVLFSLLKIGLRFVDYFGMVFKNRADKTESKMDDQLIPFIIEVGKITVYVILFFVLLGKVFDIDVTALAAGLGIGGIAIAMASKESLENLLGSFTIFFDKPFVVGDLVTTGNITGIVEKVGFRSTRIQTFDKSIVTVPNKNMISAELDNLGLRKVRRARFYIGLTYDTTIDQMKQVVKEIETLINNHPRTDQEGRVKFQEFGASSLDIMVLYYVASTKWDDFIDVKEDINFKIMEIVEKNNCEFAFPSTTVYLQKNEPSN